MHRCTGGESELADCGCSTGRTAERCGHKGDVGVECHVPQQCNTGTCNDSCNDTCNVNDIYVQCQISRHKFFKCLMATVLTPGILLGAS